ncbi:unnamed protein product [Pleuronectes platessa]|uniref:Uncharacterized protein n=1 Tax=Pleuronectes platessa TaxID=8262 RepID=A0A9N7U7Y5_PLEPL|nr:unnamed protein product [Pleuronectes platessa]
MTFTTALWHPTHPADNLWFPQHPRTAGDSDDSQMESECSGLRMHHHPLCQGNASPNHTLYASLLPDPLRCRKSCKAETFCGAGTVGSDRHSGARERNNRGQP